MSKRAAEDSVAAGEGAPKLAGSFALPSGPSALSTSGESMHGWWDSGKGKCKIGKDPMTARLTYEEPLEDGQRLHGWLDPVAGEKDLWQGTLAILAKGQGPWYGPSFGVPPEVVGDIRVRQLPGKEGAGEGEAAPKPAIETQIKVKDEDEDWQPATAFAFEKSLDSAAAAPSLLASFSTPVSAGRGAGRDDEEEQPHGVGKKRRSA